MNNSKTLIVYSSKYGSTEKYAKWLGESLKSEVLSMDSVDVKEIKKYDRIIAMSGTYGGRMPITDFLKNNWGVISGKVLVIVAVGMVPDNHWWSRLTYWFMPNYIKKSAKYFKIIGTSPNGQGEPVKRSSLDGVLNYLKK